MVSFSVPLSRILSANVRIKRTIIRTVQYQYYAPNSLRYIPTVTLYSTVPHYVRYRYGTVPFVCEARI